MEPRTTQTRRLDASIGLLVGLVVLLAIPKLLLSASEHGTSIDGGFYTDVAMHVAAGNGLVTDVSLYHHGYPSFPHPTAVYPLWPLIYGAAATIFPAPAVGIWLSTLLYFVALAFAFLWGRRLYPEPLWPDLLPGFGAGHIAVLTLGLHQDFFEFTSLPYTEGLSWALLMVALWRLHGRFGSPSLVGGMEAGLWCGLLFLARSQMIFVAAALVAVLGWYAVTDGARRRRWLVMLAATVAVFVATLLPHYLYVRSFVEGSAWIAMLRFDAARVPSELSEVRMLVKASGPLDWLVDRSGGFVEAFKWSGKYGYRKAFHWAHWAVPAVLVVVLARWTRARPDLRGAIAWLREPSRAPRVLALSVALVGFLSIHAIHKSYYMAWNFTRRQGLTSVFLFILALVYLARQRHWLPRFLALFLVLNTAGTGYARALDKAIRQADEKVRPYRPDWVRYLERSRGDAPLIVAVTDQQGQQLAPWTDGVGYHWVDRQTKPEDLRFMVEKLGVTQVFVGKNQAQFGVFRSRWFRETFREHRKVSGFTAYVLREPGR